MEDLRLLGVRVELPVDTRVPTQDPERLAYRVSTVLTGPDRGSFELWTSDNQRLTPVSTPN